jgi:hypothetical protein
LLSGLSPDRPPRGRAGARVEPGRTSIRPGVSGRFGAHAVEFSKTVAPLGVRRGFLRPDACSGLPERAVECSAPFRTCKPGPAGGRRHCIHSKTDSSARVTRSAGRAEDPVGESRAGPAKTGGSVAAERRPAVRRPAPYPRTCTCTRRSPTPRRSDDRRLSEDLHVHATLADAPAVRPRAPIR